MTSHQIELSNHGLVRVSTSETGIELFVGEPTLNAMIDDDHATVELSGDEAVRLAEIILEKIAKSPQISY